MPWMDVNGVSLRYEVSGHGQQDLVLMHEMGGCLESWDRVMPNLDKQFRVIRFDMRGAGMSEKKSTPFAMADLADDVSGLLAQLAVRGPVALAGCAVGAALALYVAARLPQRVSAVVAMAPATGLATDKKPEVLALAERFEKEGLRDRIVQRFPQSYPPHYFEDPAERLQVLGRLLSSDPHAYAAMYRMLCALDMQADLPRIGCPVLVLAGQHDTTRPPATVAKVAALIPNSRFQVIDSGHVMPILTPAAVAQAILDFLSAPPGTATL